MPKPRVDLGRYGIWYGGVDALTSTEARRAAQVVEELGFGALWIAEAVGRDPFVSSSILLGATDHLVVATGIANIYARDPMTMAAGQKTLAEAYPDRFLLGMGVSHGHLVADLRGHDWSKPYTAMDRYLDRMDESVFLAPSPAHDPGRVLAALGPRMLRLAATKANGAHPYFTTPDHTAEARLLMGPDALLAPELMIVVSTDSADARRVARAAMHRYLDRPNYLNNLARMGFSEGDWANGGSDRLVDAIVAWGSPEQIATRVQEHRDAGADHVCLQVLQDGSTMPEPQWRRMAEVLPLR